METGHFFLPLIQVIKHMQLAGIDLLIIVVYAVGIVSLATWVSRETRGHQKNTQDYFLAGKALPWWAIGASLIAANISAEQIIGMSGSGYVVGLAIASYEWMSAITIIIVGKFFLPIFLKNNIYTMPQYLEQRFDRRVCMLLAVFWLGVYVFVNLTSILWLGTLAINSITGLDYVYGLIMLGLLALGLLTLWRSESNSSHRHYPGHTPGIWRIVDLLPVTAGSKPRRGSHSRFCWAYGQGTGKV